MQILKEIGNYKIFHKERLREELLDIEEAGRTCYWSETGPITDETAVAFCQRIMNRKHLAMIEFGGMTVKFRGISIGETREQNRHRPVSYAERSTRYVDYSKGQKDLARFQLRFVLPPNMDENEEIDIGDGVKMTAREYLGLGEKFYRGMRKVGFKPDSARQFLWLGTESEEAVKTNFREWRHIFELRTARPAHWEIRRTMVSLLEDVRNEVPVIFDDFEEKGVDGMGIKYFEPRIKDE